MKFCNKCQQYKVIDCFYPTRLGSKKMRYRCRLCTTADQLDYRKRNREKVRETQRKYRASSWKPFQSHLINKYNITYKDYLVLTDKQSGKCAICGTKPTRRLFVDHDHKTGRVRGLLCQKCNIGVGYIEKGFDVSKAFLYLVR